MKSLFLCVFCVLALLHTTAQSGFVEVSDTSLVLDGKPFFFSGTNDWEVLGSGQYRQNVDVLFQLMKDMNMNAFRTRAYGNYPDGFHPDKNTYNEAMFEQLDYLIARADSMGIKLVLILANFWDPHGGIQKYVDWSSALTYDSTNSAVSRSQFFTDAECKQMYMEYVAYVINRTNSITGKVYRSDPTIIIWELMNEPRCFADPTGVTLAAWIDEMAGYIKSIDPNHLVATGEEGFYIDHPTMGTYAYNNSASGTDFLLNNQTGNIDLCSIHCWPDHWNMPYGDGVKWHQEHVRDAHQVLGKPVYSGEHSTMIGDEYATLEERAAYLADWYDYMDEADASGMLVWDMRTAAGGTNIHCPYHATTCKVLKDYADKMLAKSDQVIPADETEPWITAVAPRVITYSTEVVLEAATSEWADVRWSTEDKTYDRMENEFLTGQGEIHHTATMSGSDGASYVVYARARDLAGNTMDTSARISFRINTGATRNLVIHGVLEGLGGSQSSARVQRNNPGVKDISSATAISARVKFVPGEGIGGAGDIMASIFIKTADSWIESGPAATAVVVGEWNTLSWPISEFDIEGGDFADFRAIGIAFSVTGDLVWNGDIMVDDVTVSGPDGGIYTDDFERQGPHGWVTPASEAIISLAICDENVIDQSTAISFHGLAPARGPASLQLTQDRIVVRLQGTNTNAARLHLYAPNGRRVFLRMIGNHTVISLDRIGAFSSGVLYAVLEIDGKRSNPCPVLIRR